MRSKSGSSNLRALVGFTMPTNVPEGCVVQSATTGTAATVASGTGWREWNVTSHVQAGIPDGFLLRDATENAGSSPEQSFNSREAGANPPQLVITYVPAP